MLTSMPCSLQYVDKTCNGVYDMWGDFAGLDENMPITKFPSLKTLESMPYIDNDAREVGH